MIEQPLVIYNRVQWDRFRATQNETEAGKFAIYPNTTPERYPCVAKYVRSIFHNSRMPEEEVWAFFYLGEAALFVAESVKEGLNLSKSDRSEGGMTP